MQAKSSLIADVVVIGGGLVGSAIGYGLAKQGAKVLVLDGEDRDPRAANANGGLVWLQGKGLGLPAYQHWSRQSLALWPDFCGELEAGAGLDLQYEHIGGLAFCTSEEELEQRRLLMTTLDEERGQDPRGSTPDWEVVNRAALARLMPKVALGPDVVGALFGHRDGHCNPLHLLLALQGGIVRMGGTLRGGATVRNVVREAGGGFAVDFGSGRASAARLVVAAGLGSKAIAAQVGLDIPIRPQRGQMLITERVEPILPYPLFGVSQTRQGTISIGTTNEEVGYDRTTTVEATASLSAMMLSWIPATAGIKLVRQWSGLRVLTPDGYSIYAESESHPGAFVAVCHSGVTLAAAHAGPLAAGIAAGRLPPFFDDFHQRRFDVPKAA